MIIALPFGIASDDFTKLYHCNSTWCYSLGFIFSNVSFRLGIYFKLFVAFIPAVVLGLLFSDLIDELLEAQSQLPFLFYLVVLFYC
jgi:undecaprenyl-diphosphatase